MQQFFFIVSSIHIYEWVCMCVRKHIHAHVNTFLRISLNNTQITFVFRKNLFLKFLFKLLFNAPASINVLWKTLNGKGNNSRGRDSKH